MPVVHPPCRLFAVPDASQLAGRLVRFVFDGVIKRELAVVLGGAQPQQQHDASQAPQADVQQCSHRGGGGGLGRDESLRPRRAPLSSSDVDALQAKLTRALGRSLLVDADTASFYLQDAGGDMKAAMRAFGALSERAEGQGGAQCDFC